VQQPQAQSIHKKTKPGSSATKPQLEAADWCETFGYREGSAAASGRHRSIHALDRELVERVAGACWRTALDWPRAGLHFCLLASASVASYSGLERRKAGFGESRNSA
jgi:hypothetical protein